MLILHGLLIYGVDRVSCVATYTAMPKAAIELIYGFRLLMVTIDAIPSYALLAEIAGMTNGKIVDLARVRYPL